VSAVTGRTPEPPIIYVLPSEPLPPEPRRPEPPAPEAASPVRDRFEASIALATFPAALGGVAFSGSGTPIGGVRHAAYRHTGREIGLRNPTFWGGELSLGYRHPYFAVLVSGVYGGNVRADATPTDARGASVAGTGNVKVYGGGLELYGSASAGRVTFSAGAAAGLRAFSMPLDGFAPTTCTPASTRRRSVPCPETANTNATPYVQPRVRVDVALDTTQTLFLGAYLGMDALGDRSPVVGVMLGLRIPGT